MQDKLFNSSMRSRLIKLFTSNSKLDVGHALGWWVGLVVAVAISAVVLYYLYKILHIVDVEQIGDYIREKGATVGYFLLGAIVFAESGLLIGFFLPGDSLLLTAGLLSSNLAGQILNIWILVPVLLTAAIVGDSVGYWFGQKTGKSLFSRQESFLFHPRNLLAARSFYEKHGGMTIILARFTPMIRTFAPIVAGAVQMPYARFFAYNVIGALIWAVGLTLIGHFLGNIPGVEDFFLVIMTAILVLSTAPAVFHLWKDHQHQLTRWVSLRFFS